MLDITGIISNGLGIARGILEQLWKRKNNTELKKAEESMRDSVIGNESDRIISDAHKKGDLDEIRRAAAE